VTRVVEFDGRWRVKDGMFVEHWDELNVLDVFQQMGVIPPLAVSPIEAA
jgi:hypothetical protein